MALGEIGCDWGCGRKAFLAKTLSTAKLAKGGIGSERWDLELQVRVGFT